MICHPPRELELLAHVDVELAGVKRRLELRPLRYEELPGYIKDRAERRSPDEAWFRGELGLVVRIDDRPIDEIELDELLRDRAATAVVVEARRRLYEWLVEQGRVRAMCPVCGEAKELDLAYYAMAMRLKSWAVLDGLLIATPKIATPAPPETSGPHGERMVAVRGLAPRPPRPSKAARLEVVLPSARCGFGEPDDPVSTTQGDLDVECERAAWLRYVPVGRRQPADLVYWTHDQAWFRAALRLMVATVEVRDRAGNARPLAPETFTWMWLADIQFLDAVYTATHDLAIEDVEACTVRCSNGHGFLPVR